jgi:hypothetical protein
MSKFYLDLIFNESTGNVEFLIDIVNPSLTPLDIQEGIEDGSLKEEVLAHVRKNWGEDFADQLASGEVGMKCTDHSLEDKKAVEGLFRKHPLGEPQKAPAVQGPNPGSTQRQRERQDNG